MEEGLRWSFFGTTVKTIKVCRIKSRSLSSSGYCISDPGLSAFCSPPTPPPPQREDQVPLQITGKGTDHEKDLSLMFHIISHTPSAWRTMRLETPSSDILVRNRSRGRIAGWNTSLQKPNLSYKQILLIQYSILKDWPLVNPREERSINKLSQGLLILWFPQTLNCHGERQGRARGWVLTPDLYPS